MTLPYAQSYGVVPELVYATLTEPEQVTRWLPRPLKLDDQGPGTIRVRLTEQPGDQTYLSVDGRDGPWQVEVLVVAEGSGARADITVTTHRCDALELERFIAEAHESIKDLIAERFQPG